MYRYHRIVGTMVANHWKPSFPMVDCLKNHWKTIGPNGWAGNHSINGNGDHKNYWFLAMVLNCLLSFLAEAEIKQKKCCYMFTIGPQKLENHRKTIVADGWSHQKPLMVMVRNFQKPSPFHRWENMTSTIPSPQKNYHCSSLISSASCSIHREISIPLNPIKSNSIYILSYDTCLRERCFR